MHSAIERSFANDAPWDLDPVSPTAEEPGRIILAREPDFALGELKVRPSTCEVCAQDRIVVLQPRVMQVLTALARAEGEVVSRDALVALCWDGLCVGDDAINRCIGRLRRLAEIEAPGAFAITTRRRIGYSLTSFETRTRPAPSGQAPSPATPVASRRKPGPVVQALAAGALAGAVLGLACALVIAQTGSGCVVRQASPAALAFR